MNKEQAGDKVEKSEESINSIRRPIEARHRAKGEDYQPFITRQSVHGLRSNASTVGGNKIRRNHHLLSELESKFFFLSEWSPDVVDIREQWALDPEVTLKIADRLGFKHPTDPKTKEIWVMTTDFLLTIRQGESQREVPVAVKSKLDLANNRVIQKLDIEREYWKELGQKLRIVTEAEIPKIVVANISAIRGCYQLSQLPVAAVDRIRRLIEPEILEQKSPLSKITDDADDHLQISPGTTLWIVRHLLATRVWRIDMTVPFSPAEPLRLLNANDLTQNLPQDTPIQLPKAAS